MRLGTIFDYRPANTGFSRSASASIASKKEQSRVVAPGFWNLNRKAHRRSTARTRRVVARPRHDGRALLNVYNLQSPAWSLPKRLGVVEARMRFPGAGEQLRDLRLLVADDQPRGERAVPVLLRGQTAPRLGKHGRT